MSIYFVLLWIFKKTRFYFLLPNLTLFRLRGKQATFVRNDELLVAWEIFTPVLHAIEQGQKKVIEYPFGSRGPKESDALVLASGYERNEQYQWKNNGNI